MANVALLLLRQRATLFSAFTASLACAAKGNVAEHGRTSRRDSLSAMSIFRAIAIALAFVGLTSCATTEQHQFAEPTPDWRVRSGQLLYRTPKTTLVGDVLVRFSQQGDFELTFSKGPGVALLMIREDASFAEVKGTFAGGGWSGPVNQAPQELRGWLGLRDKLSHSEDRQTVQYVTGNETFLFRFSPERIRG
jgi:hypothetical protein